MRRAATIPGIAGALRRGVLLAGVLVLMDDAATPGSGLAAQGRGSRQLPPPTDDGPLSLEQALRQRRSVREFSGGSISEAQLAQLLWSAQGVTDPQGYRTAPSAGALYPLEVYVATSVEVLHYDPTHHRVRGVITGDVRDALQSAALSQQAVGSAAAVFVIAAVPDRTATKYGSSRGRRYVQLEAGHAAQNLLLQAVALGLGAVPVGAFDDAAVARILRFPAEQEPLYLIPVGRPGR